MISKFLTGFSLFSVLVLSINSSKAEIERIWLNHQTSYPTHIVINWYTEQPGDSRIVFNFINGKEYQVSISEKVKLHQVEIPLPARDVTYHYNVHSGKQSSDTYSFKGYPSQPHQLRVAAVGNWSNVRGSELTAIMEDNPHLLVTLGKYSKYFSGLCRRQCRLF